MYLGDSSQRRPAFSQDLRGVTFPTCGSKVTSVYYAWCSLRGLCCIVYCTLVKWDPGVEPASLGFLSSNCGARSVCFVFHLSTASRSHESSSRGFITIGCLCVPARRSARIGLASCQGKVQVRPCALRPGTHSYFSLDARGLLTCRLPSSSSTSSRIFFLSSFLSFLSSCI